MIQYRHNRLKALQAVLVAVLLASSPLASFAHRPAQVPEPPPYQWPRSHDYDVQHYRIEVSFDWASRSVKGETTITLRPFKSDLKELEIDAGEMAINSVRLSSGTPLKFRYEKSEKLFVRLDRAYPAGSDISFAIGYSATPKRGLTFITPTETEPDRPYQIWSQGEAEDNHYWFPCYDYPNDKATSELIATVEEKYRVISNGALIEVRPDIQKRTRRWHWKMDKPFSSYLVSIIVGEFAEVKEQYKNVPVISYVYDSQVENARLSFADTDRMMALFSEKTGYDYPHSKYAQTTVRDFGGGMENITATTLTDTAVVDRRAILDVPAEGLVAHELAHSWFGNMLTCRDWGELWLNESFATYFDALWTEHDEGKPDYHYQMYGNQQAYFQSWAQGVRRPIVTRRYSNPDAVFDNYSYARGGAVLSMLRFVLGDELFFKALGHYVKKHQWQTVETQQLVVAIEEATGQNLQWFFDEWVYQMGHPIFEIASSYDEAAKTLKLLVRQTQKADEKRPWFASPEYFIMPVDIGVTTSAGEKVYRVWIDKPEKEFSLPVASRPLIVNFDRGNYLIKQVKFERADTELSYQLLHDSDVMGRALAAVETKGRTSDLVLKALTDAALRDRFWGVRVEAVKALSELKTVASRDALVAATKDKDSRVRRVAISGLAAFKDPALAQLYIDVMNNDQSYFAIAEAARALGHSGAPMAFNVLTGALKQDSWQETVRAGVLGGLAALKDPRALDIAMKYAALGNAPALRQAAFQLLAEGGKGNDRVFDVLTAALKEQSQQARTIAIQALATLGDARAIPLLERLAATPEVPSFMKLLVAGVINQIRSQAQQGDKKTGEIKRP